MHRIERPEHAAAISTGGASAASVAISALLRRAAVELALDGARVADEERSSARAPVKGAPLLEAERREDGDEVHRRRAPADAHVFNSSRSRNCSSASGIGQRFDILHRQAVNDVAHGELDDLAALGARNVGHLHDLRGHMARRRVGANMLLDAFDQRLVEREAVCRRTNSTTRTSPDLAGRPVLADDEALDDFGQLLDLAIDLRRADAHAAGIERRVGAAVDDEAVVRGQLDIVAVAPDAGKALEVAARYLASSGSFQKPIGIDGNGAVQTSSPLSPRRDRLAVVVEDVDRHAEAAALQLAAPDRQRRAPSAKQEMMSVPPEIDDRQRSSFTHW